ncbi:glutaminyl-peptide cyclotransferase [Chloroflexota bacterium]
MTASPSPSPTPSPTLPSEARVPVFSFEVVGTYPHDPGAYTQGLVLVDGALYEGTGLLGFSTLRKVDLETGQVMQLYSLPEQLYGEGITILDDRIIQLTWKARSGFVYDRGTFELLETFRYPSEGWGITHDGTSLIMSDGTATLRFLDPETFEEISQVQVHDPYGPVMALNELEYVEGEVWANVWFSDSIARIDPSTGQVTGWINLDGLISPEEREPREGVLNGIAYDAEDGRLFVTGKLWPKLFEIQLVPPQAP